MTMGQLTAILNPLGWTIPVLPELDELTVGGLVMGTGVESASHKHGLFQHICSSYELVLSDGSLITCSKDKNPELFHAVPWSYGTLGLLTSVEITIVPSKRFVQLKYHPVCGLEKFEEQLRELCGGPDEFVEGFIFNENMGVITTGNLVDNAEADKVRRKHAFTKTSNAPLIPGKFHRKMV